MRRAIKSVLDQTFNNWEIVIVDNHSQDDTDDVCESFNDARIRLYKIHNNGVIAASRNLAIKRARGKYIAFLDSDDWWRPQKLEKSFECLEQGNDVVYHKLWRATKPRQKIFWIRSRIRELRHPIFNDLICNGNMLPNSSVVIRKHILEEMGGLSENIDLITVEDFDTWLRAAKITEKFKMLPETLGFYGFGDKNTSGPITAIKTSDVIFNYYSSGNSWWSNYAKGIAYYKVGNLDLAEKFLKRVHGNYVPYRAAIKSKILILYTQILRKYLC